MASTKDMVLLPGRFLVWRQGKRIGRGRSIWGASGLLLPLSPCGRGWTRCEASRTGEGSVSAETDPSSGASRHLLPQGEREFSQLPSFLFYFNALLQREQLGFA